MQEKKEVIEIGLSLQREMAKVFGVTERTVQSAMRFDTNSSLSRLLRRYALAHGGEQYRIVIKKERVDSPSQEKKTIIL